MTNKKLKPGKVQTNMKARAAFDLNGSDAFYIGNAIKYILRHNHKGGKEDIDKAIWYLARYKRKYPSNNNPSPYKAMQEFNKALNAFAEDASRKT